MRRAAASTVLGLLAAASAAAQSYRVETAQAAPPPQELAAAVRDTLGEDVIRVHGPKGLYCEVWLRKAAPVSATPSKELGIGYGELAEGTLIGAVRLPAGGSDYRSQKVPAGVYALRYALHPVDGNHMGVAPQRDFLMFTPAAADASPAAVTGDALIVLSRKGSGTGHPAVWSLAAPEREGGANPSMVHYEEEDHWVVRFRLMVEGPDGAAKPLAMALVVVGHAAEA